LFDTGFEILEDRDVGAVGLQGESALLDLAAAGRAVAHLWEAPLGLVAPRSYRRYAQLAQVQADFARHGVAVELRPSGGGVVPQGPGILNMSLAFPVSQPIGSLSDAIYRRLCAILQTALAGLGVRAAPLAVAGSFCDGRYNLAVGGRKIAGAAQYWRRRGANGHAVLAHAVLLVDADPVAATGLANAFEAALGSGRAYDPDAVTSVALSVPGNDADSDRGLSSIVRGVLLQALAKR
jgi:lipoate-protein ligase A